MKNIFLLILLLLAFSSYSASAATMISCTHSELCKLAADIGREAGITNTTYNSLVKISGDPHEFELSMSDVKNLINAPVLIVGPRELNPWMNKVSYQRSKIKSLKTISLSLTKNAAIFYPGGSQEALSHFWLYPKIFCEVKLELAEKMLAQKLITKAIQANTCLSEAEAIENKLKTTFTRIKYPVILTHDAIEALLNSLKNNQTKVVAIKGSGHHDEASTSTVKRLYDALRSPVVIWIEEEGIHVPQNIISKKRKQDLTLKIATDFSNNESSFAHLESLNESLVKVAGQIK